MSSDQTPQTTQLRCERLEPRETPAAAALAAGVLSVTGTPGNDRILVYQDGTDLVVLDGTAEIGRFASAAVNSIAIDGGGGNDVLKVARGVAQPATITGGDGNDKLVGGGGSNVLSGGNGTDNLFGGGGADPFGGGGGQNAFDGGAGPDNLFRVLAADVVMPDPADRILAENPAPAAMQETITADEVNTLIRRAAAASASTDAIIAIVDRNGRILGVRVESGVAPEIVNNPEKLTFAIDGAVAKARTGAFFGNNQAPLTSRTVQFISQSTITQREVESDPNITDPNSTLRGPGFVAAVNTGGHFPPGIANTPQVDLFQIEHTNRDSNVSPGADRIIGTADDVPLAQRFNIDPNFVPPGQSLFAPISYGRASGLFPTAEGRGIATLPGGIPIYKNGQVVGGIGVFFPGKTGYATEENSSLSFTFDPTKADRTLEAEWMAYAAVGGYQIPVESDFTSTAPVGTLGGVPLPAGFGLPVGRIDLVGIQLDIVGQGGAQLGLERTLAVGEIVGRGNPDNGVNMPVAPGGTTFQNGLRAPDGWLVTPHDGNGITRREVEQIIRNGLEESFRVRAAIRLPKGSPAKFVFAVADRDGNVVGLYREPDATIFSIDVAVAKARNVAYYNDPGQLLPIDNIPGVAPGTAFTNRTFRYVGEPRFPEAIDFAPPGPFSQLNDDPTGTDRLTGRLVPGAAKPASVYQSVVGYDSFNPGTNFHQPGNILNQNGIVFFPGSSGVYKAGPNGTAVLSGGFGVSGDGVDQDDVTTDAGIAGFAAPGTIRADTVYVRGVRLPYQKFNRNPEDVRGPDPRG